MCGIVAVITPGARVSPEVLGTMRDAWDRSINKLEGRAPSRPPSGGRDAVPPKLDAAMQRPYLSRCEFLGSDSRSREIFL